MASIRKLVRKDVTKAFKVIYRDRDRNNMQASKTFDDLRDTNFFKDFLNSNNQSLVYATKSAARARSVALKIKDILETHFVSLVNVQADTLVTYKNLAAKHIISFIGNIPIDHFSVVDAQCWFKNIKGSSKTKKNVQAILSAAIKTAAGKGLVETNVVAGLKSVRQISKHKPVFLASEQIVELIEVCPKFYSLLLEFLVVSGFRWGEAVVA